MTDPNAPRRRQVTEHDRDRIRASLRVVAAGPIAGVVAALVIAVLGGSGRAGLAVLLLACSAGCIVGALVTLVHALADEYRRRPVALRRVGWGAGLMLATMVLLVLLGGVAGAMS